MGGLSKFTGFAKTWRLSVDQQITLLGSPARSTYFKWKKHGGNIPRDTIERVDSLVWLRNHLGTAAAARAWLNTTTRHLDYATPLQVMLYGGVADILRVKAFRAACSGLSEAEATQLARATHNNGDNHE